MPVDHKSNDSRRRLLKLPLLAGLAASLPTYSSAAQQAIAPPLERPLPTVDTRFPVEVAPGIFLIPDKRISLVPNIAIIVGTKTALVVDCGLGVDSAEKVLRLARQLAPGRRIVLTVTHAHPEHGFGAQVFKKDAQIYYNTAQRDYVLRSGKILLQGFREGVLPPAQKYLLDNIELTPPHKTYDGPTSTLDLGGRQVHLQTWGTAHSPGDQIIFLPKERILFAGDLLEERMFPIVPVFPPMITANDIDLRQWEVALNDIVRLDPRLIVPGHGNLAGVELPEAVLGYFQFVRELIAKNGVESPDLNEAIQKRYSTWENPEYIQRTIEYFRQKGDAA